MRPLLPLLLALTTGVSLVHAQGPGGMGGGMQGGRPGMISRGRMREPPSEDLIAGPYQPDSMTRKFGLDSSQALRYRAVWDSMMAATRPVRDSVREAMAGIRRAPVAGRPPDEEHGGRREDRRREREERARMERRRQEEERIEDRIQELGKRLKKEEERFDKVVRRFLTEDQWGDFKYWRDRRRETERELRRQRMEEEGPPGMPLGRERGR